jgi:hypothetical protein
VGGRTGRLTKPAIYKVGYKSGNPQRNRMSTNQRSSRVHPATHNRFGSVISISDSPSDVDESVTEPDLERFSPENQLSLPENQLGLPENQLGLLENGVWVDRPDVSNASETSSKHCFGCSLMKTEDSV